MELLREENMKKEAFIEKIRKEHIIQLQDYEENVKELTHEKQMIEKKASNDLKKYSYIRMFVHIHKARNRNFEHCKRKPPLNWQL